MLCLPRHRAHLSFCTSRRISEGIRSEALRSSQGIRDRSAFRPTGHPASSSPRQPRHPWLGATVAARWGYGVGPMGPDPHGDNKPPPSHQQASNQPTSPSSKRAENTMLRAVGAVPLGPTDQAAKAVGRGSFRRKGLWTPSTTSQSQSTKTGPSGWSLLAPPNYGTLPETEMRPPSPDDVFRPVCAVQTGGIPGRNQECPQ
jgi:hypothetical protein